MRATQGEVERGCEMNNSVYPADYFREPQPLDPNLCFVLSPLNQEFRGAYSFVKKAAESLGYRVVRVDELTNSGIIQAEIWSHLSRAGIVIADLSGWNPNVMFELGVAAATKRVQQIVLVMNESDRGRELPFDVSPFRHFFYTNTIDGAERLETSVKLALLDASSQGGLLPIVRDRMARWIAENHDPRLLVSLEMLVELRSRADLLSDLDGDLKSFLIASAIQHGEDLIWWWDMCSDSRASISIAAETMVFGPHLRPRFRAAFLVQQLDPDDRTAVCAQLSAIAQDAFGRQLVEATASGRIIHMINESELLSANQRNEILTNFSIRTRRILKL
jgi:hypothetical protein